MNQTFKALSHPVRREIVAMLRSGPLGSGEIAQRFDLAWPSVTAHLKVLRAAGLVDAERNGTSIRYRLRISAAEEAIAFLIGLVEAVPANARSSAEEEST